jgi:hypothetical protein
MKYCILCLVALLCLAQSLCAQRTYTITTDSVKLTSSDSSELIIENHTQNVKGFLFNTGNGRTIFRKGIIKVNDSLYLIGGDTLKYNAWVQNGNTFGTTGILGTLDNNSLDLYTNNTQRMRFTNTGKLLIGTTTDNNRETIQLNGSMYTNGYISNFLAPSGTTSGAIRLRWGTGDGSYISFYKQANTNRRSYIGTPSDSRPLIIFDSVAFSFSATPQVSIGSEWGLSSAKFAIVKPYTQTLDVLSAGRVLTDTTSIIDLQVKSNGNVMVGGGVDNGNKLQVAGTGKISFQPNLSRPTDQILIGGAINTTDGQNSLFSTLGATGSWKTVLCERDGNIGVGMGGFPWVVGSAPLRINSGGAVSVKTQNFFFGNTGGPNNSSYLLTSVSNTNEWNEGLGAYPNGQNYYFFGTRLGAPEGSNKRAPLKIGADQLMFMTGVTDVEVARFSESGNLGLGTASPSAQLHTTGTIRFAGLTNVDTLTRILVSDASGNLFYRNASSLAANDILHSSLAINGPIKAKSLTLSQDGWPDYVFDSTYRLSPLKEVEDYIRQNSHLPGIPSAGEAARDGVSVGETQVALLKKIEELTLYNIAQQKRIDRQEEMLQTQSKTLELLQQQLDEVKKRIDNSKTSN